MFAPPVILGLWPIAGIATVGVSERDALETLRAALDAGITCFDTAMAYGYHGESDRWLGRVLDERQVDARVIGKVGQRWIGSRRVIDGQPKTLLADAETSLARLGRPSFDCLMLHSVDPAVPIERSAEALAELQRRELCRHVGVCNVTPQQLQRFAQVVPCTAIQCPLNVMQQDSLQGIIPAAHQRGVEVYAYWALMKGMLAGKIDRDHQFAPGDPRPGYDIFQGEFRRRAHRIVDGLKQRGRHWDRTVAQLAIGWVLTQPGVTSVLAGARTPDQVRELAASRPLSPSQAAEIDHLLTTSP